MKIALALVLTLIAAPAWAGSFTILTTAAQDAAITAIVTEMNAQRADAQQAAKKSSKPPLTELDYVNSVVQPMFDQWVAQQRAVKTAPIIKLLETADTAKLQAVMDALK